MGHPIFPCNGASVSNLNLNYLTASQYCRVFGNTQNLNSPIPDNITIFHNTIPSVYESITVFNSIKSCIVTNLSITTYAIPAILNNIEESTTFNNVKNIIL